MSAFDNINDNTVEPLPVTIAGDDTSHTLGNIVLGIIAIGTLYSVYCDRRKRKQRDAVHSLEVYAAENYRAQTELQAKTARVEYEAACEKHGISPEAEEIADEVAEIATSVDELSKMLSGDNEAIVRNLPETEETTA